jgi:hypothetical protein
MQSPCAHYVPHCTAQALRARGNRAVVLPHASGLPAIIAGWTWCATSTESAAVASTRQQRYTARPLFTRPVWPRRALRSHDYECAPRKLGVHVVALCSPCGHHAPHYIAQALRAETAPYATLARSSTRSTYAKRACSRFAHIISPAVYCPGTTRPR